MTESLSPPRIPGSFTADKKDGLELAMRLETTPVTTIRMIITSRQGVKSLGGAPSAGRCV